MIKKNKFIYLPVIVFVVLILTQCSVNDITGIIQVKNYTNTPI